MKRACIVALGALVVLTVGASTAVAGKGKGSGSTVVDTSTITLDQAAPRYGDVVTFSATYPSMRETALVWLSCVQDGHVVYQSGGVPGGQFPLGGAGVSSSWSWGYATCTATLYYDTYQGRTQTGQVTLASTTFSVAP